MKFYSKEFLALGFFAIAPTFITPIINLFMKYMPKTSSSMTDKISKILMDFPEALRIILIAIPEQIVLAILEPEMPIIKRLIVSLAMLGARFFTNGIGIKPDKAYKELIWIFRTALFSYTVIGVKKKTVVALIAADACLALSLRDLI